jgi:uncharacterized protein YndB with AHSA1/START domain
MDVEREIVLESPMDDVWTALTEPEQLEEWFANDVELDLREGGRAAFRWENGEERGAVVEELEVKRRLVLRWLDDDGLVRLELDPVPEGTRLRVVETSPEFGAALELRAFAACAACAAA